MTLSRPASVLILMAILVAATAWYAPPQQQTGRMSVMLPHDVYTLLARKGEADTDAAGRPRPVALVIEELAKQ